MVESIPIIIFGFGTILYGICLIYLRALFFPLAVLFMFGVSIMAISIVEESFKLLIDGVISSLWLLSAVGWYIFIIRK